MPSATLSELPEPPDGAEGWPWTEQSELLSETQTDGTAWPKISVVTPSYNQGQFIEETIRSVLLQGYPSLEYIVIDGGSDDSTVEILERYDPWIDYWVSEEDQGQADAINKGLSQSSGTVAAYLNSDDMYLPGALNHVGAIYEEKDFDVFMGRRKENVASFSEKFDLKHPRSSIIGYLKQFKPFQEPYWFPEGHYDIPQECVFWDNKKYENKSFDENYEFAMDAEWFRRIFSGARVAYSSKKVGFFRKHDGQKTAKMDEVLAKEADEIDKKYEHCKNKVPKSEYIKVMIKYYFYSAKYITSYCGGDKGCVMCYENNEYL
jgi:glycosyltransferase involved in cell wall biosynthesis